MVISEPLYGYEHRPGIKSNQHINTSRYIASPMDAAAGKLRLVLLVLTLGVPVDLRIEGL